MRSPVSDSAEPAGPVRPWAGKALDKSDRRDAESGQRVLSRLGPARLPLIARIRQWKKSSSSSSLVRRAVARSVLSAAGTRLIDSTIPARPTFISCLLPARLKCLFPTLRGETVSHTSGGTYFLHTAECLFSISRKLLFRTRRGESVSHTLRSAYFPLTQECLLSISRKCLFRTCQGVPVPSEIPHMHRPISWHKVERFILSASWANLLILFVIGLFVIVCFFLTYNLVLRSELD